MPPRIAILTFCVGADYKRAMKPGLDSKRDYAKRHGYEFITEGCEECWDKSKPIPWSKFNYILKHINDYDFLFWSDADVIITNPHIRLEDQVLPLLPADKDILWSHDACRHLNNGHLLIRGRSAWVTDYFRRAAQQTDLTYHVWWDNAAMIRLYESNAADRAKMETCEKHWLFNAFIYGPTNSATDSTTRLYEPGDFLIHFAGVYDNNNIHRLMLYARRQATNNKPLDKELLNRWRFTSPKNLVTATEEVENLPV